MGVHMPPSPMPYQASRRGGRSRHGRTLRNGTAAPVAVVQPQRGQRHVEPLARTWKRHFRAHARRCRCARAVRHRPPPIGGQDPPPGSRLERHVVNPSIAVPGREDRSRSFSSTILSRQPCSPPCFSITASSMPRIACSIRSISQRAARPGSRAVGPEAVAALAHFPRIVRARPSSLGVRTTATTSTDRPCLWSACQRPRCAPPHERHRQFDWEVAACASGGSPVDPDRQESALDAERLERADLLVLGRQPRQIRVLDHMVEREEAAHQHFLGGGPAVANVLGAERAVGPPGEDPADPPAPKHLLLRQPLVRHGADEPERLPAVEAEMGRELGAGEHAAVEADERDPLRLARRRGTSRCVPTRKRARCSSRRPLRGA